VAGFVGSRQSFSSETSCGHFDGIDNTAISGAPAVVRVERTLDPVVRRTGVGCQQRFGACDDAGGTETTLHPTASDKTVGKYAPLLLVEAFDGKH
jgi:hypothetical protein